MTDWQTPSERWERSGVRPSLTTLGHVSPDASNFFPFWGPSFCNFGVILPKRKKSVKSVWLGKAASQGRSPAKKWRSSGRRCRALLHFFPGKRMGAGFFFSGSLKGVWGAVAQAEVDQQAKGSDFLRRFRQNLEPFRKNYLFIMF